LARWDLSQREKEIKKNAPLQFRNEGGGGKQKKKGEDRSGTLGLQQWGESCRGKQKNNYFGKQVEKAWGRGDFFVSKKKGKTKAIEKKGGGANTGNSFNGGDH